MMTAPPAAIEVAGLTKVYGRQQVVTDVSFTVRPGSVTGFLGPNDAGKSTTLRILVGLASPDTGRAAVFGTPYATQPNPGRRIGILLDASAQHFGRTGREVLAPPPAGCSCSSRRRSGSSSRSQPDTSAHCTARSSPADRDQANHVPIHPSEEYPREPFPPQPARTEAAALTVAAIGIIIQIIGGVKYPAVPPGLLILLAGAALVAFLPWRRIGALIGALVGAFMIFGTAASTGRYDLTHPGHPGAFIGTWIQLIAVVVVAVVAGIAALTVRNQRLARA